MSYLIETTLIVFWAGYLGLHLWLLATPENQAADAVPATAPDELFQGESECIPQATR